MILYLKSVYGTKQRYLHAVKLSRQNRILIFINADEFFVI